MAPDAPAATKRILLVSVNMYKEYSLAIHFCRLYAYEDDVIRNGAEIVTAEFTLQQARDEMLSAIRYAAPDLLAFSCNIWNIKVTMELAESCKRLLKVPIVFGGQEVTNSSIDYIDRDFVDIVVDGEGEATFRDIVKNFVTDAFRTLETIPGIQFKREGKVIRNGKREPIRNLDEIPSPYLRGALEATNENHLGAMIELTRGCPQRCSFCFEADKYPRARCFSTDRIRKEMEYLFANGIRRFHFLDPIIANSNLKHLQEIDALLGDLRRRADMLFIPIEVYAEHVNEKNAVYFRHYSAYDVGLQTVNEDVHRNIRRNFNLERFEKGYRLLYAMKKEINVYLILGLPGESYESFERSLAYAVSLKPTFLHINLLLLLNGSPMRADVDRYGIVYQKEAPYVVYANDTFPERAMNTAKLFSRASARMYNLNRALFNTHKQVGRAR